MRLSLRLRLRVRLRRVHKADKPTVSAKKHLFVTHKNS